MEYNWPEDEMLTVNDIIQIGDRGALSHTETEDTIQNFADRISQAMGLPRHVFVWDSISPTHEKVNWKEEGF